jgi:drug/metabolite transporter superfamily protein YnfA
LTAGAVAAVASGAPSTLWALAAGRDPLEATLAAGSMLVPEENRRGRLVAAAVPVHLALSLSWAVVLAGCLPRRTSVAAGAVAGLAIAALDLGLVARRLPRVRALPLLPQLADHAMYGATVAAVLERRRRAIIQP